MADYNSKEEYMEACRVLIEVLQALREEFFGENAVADEVIQKEIAKHIPGSPYFRLNFSTVSVDLKTIKVVGKIDEGDPSKVIDMYTYWLTENNIKKNEYTQGTVNMLSLLGTICGYMYYHRVVTYMAYDKEDEKGIRPPVLYIGLGHPSGYAVKVSPVLGAEEDSAAPTVQ